MDLTEHAVGFRMPVNRTLWGAIGYHWINEQPLLAETTEPFDWLRTNARAPWHWVVLGNFGQPDEYRVNHNNRWGNMDHHLVFLFENPTDAMLFKLTWSGE